MRKDILHFKLKSLIIYFARALFLLGLGFIVLYPLMLKTAIALRSFEDIMDSSIIFLPKNFTLKPILTSMDMMNFSVAFKNSFIIAFAGSLLHVFACTITAYSLAKFQYPFKKLLYFAVIVTFFVPPQLLSVSTYSVFRNFDVFGLFQSLSGEALNLLDNPVSLLALYATANALKSGLYIYLLIQFFRNMPKELDEAASVDGAGLARVFVSIVLPSARIMMVTVFLFSFVWQWTDLQYTSMFFRNFQMLSLRLQLVGQTYQLSLLQDGIMNPLLVSQIVNAGSVAFVIPLVAIYITCNKFFIQGIERSGIVG